MLTLRCRRIPCDSVGLDEPGLRGSLPLVPGVSPLDQTLNRIFRQMKLNPLFQIPNLVVVRRIIDVEEPFLYNSEDERSRRFVIIDGVSQEDSYFITLFIL